MEDIFKVRNYQDAKRGRLIWRLCVICNKDFQVPYINRHTIITCCSYCQDLRIAWTKNRGKYKLCKICDKPIWCQPRKEHKYCSRKCKDSAVSVYSWDRNSAIMETGRKKYYGPNWLIQRKRARERDEQRCRLCSIHENEYGQELSVHHIVPFVYFQSYEDANSLDNLLSLCEPCHRKVHQGENHPSAFCPNKILFKNERHKIWQQQYEKAQKVINLLLNTDLSLKQISDQVGLSYGNVQRMYRGDSWKTLYEKAPRLIRPRKKANHGVKNME
ncbi:HNH endonuclease [Ectobacillus funiculus]|uniref:Putative HNH nuclease YajD n=1 Tax=Ectobacillus funiculus TaxID=137993 RepID=A0ABV5WGN6_9BACI